MRTYYTKETEASQKVWLGIPDIALVNLHAWNYADFKTSKNEEA